MWRIKTSITRRKPEPRNRYAISCRPSPWPIRESIISRKRCMAKADPHDMREAPYHQINQTTCLMCPARFCITCFIGCPACGCGKGWERRDTLRVPAEDIQVTIRADGMSEDRRCIL